jgi:CubicO group peptidase (beta-lactamase class C family)
MASSTKIIASIALLQCVDKGLIGLDEPVNRILPEFDGKQLLEASPETGFTSRPSQQKITARHLLSHTSGLAYRFLDPLLIKWAQTPEGKPNESYRVTERYNIPCKCLIFQISRISLPFPRLRCLSPCSIT